MATRLFPPFYQFEDGNGKPLVGGTLEFYAAGTSTPKDTFSDAGLTIPNGTITLNSLGRSPVAIFAEIGEYRIVLKDAAGTIIGDDDPVEGAPDEAPVVSTLDNTEPVLFNSTFTVWQRGTSVAIPASSSTVAAIYGPDGWAMETGAGQACTISQQAGLTSDALYCMRVQRNSGQTGTAAMVPQQWLPTALLAQLRGKNITVGVDIRAGANFSGVLTILFYTGTGAEGRLPRTSAYTGQITVLDSGSFTPTTATQRFNVTSSVVVPTNATQGALVFRWAPTGTAGANDYFEVGRPVLAPSPGIDPPFVSDAYELQRAQRWYQIVRAHHLGFNSSAGVATFSNGAYFNRTMRDTPTVTFLSNVVTSNVSARTPVNITPSGCGIQLTVNAGPVGFFDTSDYSADARL